MAHGNLIDLVGATYGRLVVLERATSAGGGRVHWLCRCSCGGCVVVPGCNLKTGNTQSCGCLKLDYGTTHGHTTRGKYSRVYWIWHAMRQRCSNKKFTAYRRYGGRGISVCREWDHAGGFESFLAYMGEPPPGMTLGREDNDGNYEPGNVGWETCAKQSRNRCNTRLYELDGKSLVLTDWCKIYGINLSTANKRLRKGVALKDALELPVDKRFSRGGRC